VTEPQAVSAAQGSGATPAGALRLALVLGQLALLVLVIREFQLENRTVFFLLVAAACGVAVHAMLPLAYRLPFFAMLSLASVPAVLGLPAGAAVLALGFALIGVCHLPIRFPARVAILVALGAGLLVSRNLIGATGPLATVGPVLGALFMFRLALYARSVRYGNAPADLTWGAAYLFMLPNVCYPLFPVVDYDTFVATHFDADRFRTYDRGLRFMLRGIIHLLVYRVVFYDLALDSLYLNSLGDVVRYVVSTFFLYVKVSGQFHLIVGLLCLYGFRLPETNHLYFLATSPSDFWRRINIYWKDFMMKLVYWPSFFRLRRHGKTLALALATASVFVATWLLHAYQFNWLQGGGHVFAKRDLAFWGLFGAIMLAVTLWEARPGRPAVRKTDRSWSLARGLSTVTTFSVIAVLWSLWNATTFGTWLFMWTQVRYSTGATWAALAVLVVAFVALAGFGWGAPTLEPAQPAAEALGSVVRAAARRGAVIACLVALGTPTVQAVLSPRLAVVDEHLHGVGWSPAQIAANQVGYYQQLTSPVSRLAVPWRPAPKFPTESLFVRDRHDFLISELVPSRDITFLGMRLTTNSWGMRDREYNLAKPPGTYRIALFGPSDVMGWGVADSEVFSAVFEAKLDSVARARGQHVEVLNFGMPAYSLVQEVLQLQSAGLRFSPDLAVLAIHPYDLAGLQQVFSKAIAKGYPIPDSALARLAARVGIGPGLPGALADLRLVEEDIDRVLLERARAAAARTGAALVVLFMRTPDVTFAGNLATARRATAAVGLPSLDCTGVWDNVSPRAYRRSAEDAHPNAAGHRLIAACVFDQLMRAVPALGARPQVPVR